MIGIELDNSTSSRCIYSFISFFSSLIVNDRNGRYFEPILNYLRTGQIIYERDLNPKGILEEAKFFGIQEMIEKFERIVNDESSVINDENTPLSRNDVVRALIQTSNKSELRFQVLKKYETIVLKLLFLF